VSFPKACVVKTVGQHREPKGDTQTIQKAEEDAGEKGRLILPQVQIYQVQIYTKKRGEWSHSQQDENANVGAGESIGLSKIIISLPFNPHDQCGIG
jgi:hypothetical protein